MSSLPAWIDLDQFWWILLSVMIGLVVVPYLLGPVLIYFTLRVSGYPALDEITLDSPVLPEPVKNYLLPTVRQMQADGFEVLGAYFAGSLVPNVQSFLVLMGNRAAKDTALLAVMYARVFAKHRLQQAHVEYCSRFTDGTVVDTNNSPELSAFAPLPWKHVYSLPWVEGPRQLYRIHRAAVEYLCPEKVKEWRVGAAPETYPPHAAAAIATRPVGDDAGAYLCAALVEETSSQLGTGYLYRDSAGDFRPTLKGAVLMTYKNLWPFTALRRARRRRRGEQFLRQLRIESARDNRAELPRVSDDEYSC